LKSINLEAKSNKEVFDQSFKPNVGKKIIYRAFDFSIAESFMSDKNFLEFASSRQVEDLNTYLLVLRRANSFRVSDRKYWETPIQDSILMSNLRFSFQNLMPACKNSICNVIKSTAQKD
jgi:hypothetical protein